MAWLSRVLLASSPTGGRLKAAQEGCGRLLPLVAGLLPQLPLHSSQETQLGWLQFCHWAVSHLSLRQQVEGVAQGEGRGLGGVARGKGRKWVRCFSPPTEVNPGLNSAKAGGAGWFGESRAF